MYFSPMTSQNGGGLAQFVVAQERLTALRPTGSSAAKYASLPVAGVTALQVLKSIGAEFDGIMRHKYNILIIAASGGVGHYLVQLAHLAGFHVTATCGARNIDLIKSLGANDVLDYKTLEGQRLTSPSGKLYDYVINCVPSTEWSNALDSNLAKDGTVIEVTPTPVTMARYWMKKLVWSTKKLEVFLLKEKRGDLQFMVNLVNEGLIRTVLDSTYTLDKAQVAWDRCIGGHATGKIIVEM
jgi:chloroplastic oxoene reductase